MRLLSPRRGATIVSLLCLSTAITTAVPSNAFASGTPSPLPPGLTSGSGALSSSVSTTVPAENAWAGVATTANYDSMAASMLAYWQQQSGTDLSTFAQRNSAMLSSLLGSQSTSALGALGGTKLASGQLNTLLASSGATMNLSGLSSMDQLLGVISAKSSTLDGKATLAGISLATQLGSTYAPTLRTSALPSDAALFGVFFDKSLANLIGGHPNLISQISASGLGSSSDAAAWASAMASGAKATQVSLASLPNACLAAMMQSVGTGVAKADAGLGAQNCGACQVGGVYLHNQMLRLFDPATNSVLPSSNTGSTNSSTWSTMQGWLQQGTLAQNPGLASSLSAQNTPNTSVDNACLGSSSSTSNALKIILPGVFGALGK